MTKVLFPAVALAVLVSSGVALADAPPPCPTSAPTSQASQNQQTTTATATQSASATAGLIADRVATVVSNINVGGGLPSGTTGPQTNVGCGGGDLTEAALDPLDRALGVSTGESANGGGAARLNSVWAGGSYNHVKKTDTNGNYSGSVKNGVVGYDRRVTRNLILGIATGYETVNIGTKYNSGTVEGSSTSLSPYLGYVFTDWLSLDGSLGYSWIKYDFSRNSGGVYGTTSAGRVFGSTNLNATHRLGDFKLKGALGYMRLYEQQDAYVDSANAQVDKAEVNFGQIRSTVGGSYDVVTGFGVLSPNAFVRLEYDLPASHAVMLGNNWMSSADRTGAVFGVGIDAAIGPDLLFNLSATTTQFRQNTEAYSLIGNVRYSF